MFKLSAKYKAIKKVLKHKGILQEIAMFQAVKDDVFYYSYVHGSMTHEFFFECDDALIKEMPIKNILNLKDMVYFGHFVHVEKLTGETELLTQLEWCIDEMAILN